MMRKLAALGAICAVVVVVAFAQSGDGRDTLARIFGSGPEAIPLTDKNTGEPITLEAVQKEAEWRKDTAEKLRDVK